MRLRIFPRFATPLMLLGALLANNAFADRDELPSYDDELPSYDNELPSHDELQAQLQSVFPPEIAGGIGLDYWGVVVNRDGVVTAVAYSGRDRFAPIRLGRVLAAAKASTANNIAGSRFLVSTAQLFTTATTHGIFQSLIEAYPTSEIALKGPVKQYGTKADPMVGHVIGGATTLGGGIALYNKKGEHIGAIGLGGQHVPCADHNAAWIIRHQLKLDNLPEGLGFSPTQDDNIVYDVDENGVSASTFGTIECTPEATAISQTLPVNYPLNRVKVQP